MVGGGITWAGRVELRRRDNWLVERRRDFTIGGSTVAKILRVSPFGGPWNVYAERVLEADQVNPPEVGVAARGHAFEPMIVEGVGARIEQRVETAGAGCEFFIRHASQPWAAASPDGFARFTGRPNVVDEVEGVEAKTSTKPKQWGEDGTTVERYTDAATSVIPAWYLTQVYWYLEVTGAPRWHVGAMIARPFDFPELRVYTVERDADVQSRMLDAVGEWRERHLIRGVEPDVDESDACRRAATLRFRSGGRKSDPLRVADDDERALMAKFASLQAQRERVELDLDHCKSRLLWRIGDDRGLSWDGTPKGPRVVWFNNGRTRTLRVYGFDKGES